MSYIQRGLIPDGGGMYFLPRRVGLARAKELIFTGRTLTADEALSIGMIERVTTPDALLAEAAPGPRELSAGLAAALALAKTTMNQSFELPVEQVFAQGSQAQAICYSTREHQESVAAFLAKSARDGAREHERDRQLLRPASVAVIGASADPAKMTGRPVGYLQKHGFAGAIWPVNPRASSIAGLPCYADVAALPAAPDVGIVLVGAGPRGTGGARPRRARHGGGHRAGQRLWRGEPGGRRPPARPARGRRRHAAARARTPSAWST